MRQDLLRSTKAGGVNPGDTRAGMPRRTATWSSMAQRRPGVNPGDTDEGVKGLAPAAEGRLNEGRGVNPGDTLHDIVDGGWRQLSRGSTKAGA